MFSYVRLPRIRQPDNTMPSSDLPETVPNCRIAVTLEELIGILLEIQFRRHRQDRSYVIAPGPLYEPGENIVREGIKDRLVAREITQIRQRRNPEIRGQVVEYAAASLILTCPSRTRSLSNALDMVERKDSDLESHPKTKSENPPGPKSQGV